MQIGSAALYLAGSGHCICVIRSGAEPALPDDHPPILERRSHKGPIPDYLCDLELVSVNIFMTRQSIVLTLFTDT